MVTGICFFISIFFAPIFASIPPWATGCTLIIVGAMMASAAKDINWRYWGDALPAFLTLAVMPFTYSIAYGLIAGIVSYAVINTLTWLIELASGGRIVVPDKELREPWTWRIKGGLLPMWIVRLGKGYAHLSSLSCFYPNVSAFLPSWAVSSTYLTNPQQKRLLARRRNHHNQQLPTPFFSRFYQRAHHQRRRSRLEDAWSIGREGCQDCLSVGLVWLF